ncbi:MULTISPECIES: GlxA family transcriptional regulator [Pseudonocardia]|uniref:HTH-type transcriptional regulator CdhR n=2 Tax=Pseudonocardia TaxID=1847 RepID=A0A1Y2N1R4_PSEAH|nr:MULTISPECIES: DJ-1/PfpI family protein [Pseudonocardia]OSY41414.1 HTH-type transcriptional regulator CdhR [Pseudonocardia autotrophica]TDN71371.1 AraC family transcriptional regulator with amidase-like domain [Pseudonocardia autotrophica]BBG02048.1 AraC family transcriptional regulator [Pseudonocardia autotrophica]GEC24062.1 AraC family transcriptional regulator [Pseudonocardia saturnea]
MTGVVFVVPPRVHLLDLAGPAQVFSTAADLGLGYPLSYVGDRETITSHQGVPLTVRTGAPLPDRSDVVVVPGHRIGDREPRGGLSADLLEWVRAHHDAGGRVMSVCAGAFSLAEAGLLDGRRATTHHDIQNALARRFPAVRVVPDVLYVADDRIVTSAGIASGIDLALHLVAVEHGPAPAARIARSMVVPARRNGSDPQASTMLRHRDHLVDAVHRAQDVLDARFTETVPLAVLARSARVSERTLTRRFRAATGRTPLQYQQALRIERAEALIGQGWTAEAAARDVGFGDARMLRRLRAGSHTG